MALKQVRSAWPVDVTHEGQGNFIEVTKPLDKIHEASSSHNILLKTMFLKCCKLHQLYECHVIDLSSKNYIQIYIQQDQKQAVGHVTAVVQAAKGSGQ